MAANCFLFPVLENSIKLTVLVLGTPGHSPPGIKDNISGRGREEGGGGTMCVSGGTQSK